MLSSLCHCIGDRIFGIYFGTVPPDSVPTVQSKTIQSGRFSPISFQSSRFSPIPIQSGWYSPNIFQSQKLQSQKIQSNQIQSYKLQSNLFSPKIFSPNNFSPRIMISNYDQQLQSTIMISNLDQQIILGYFRDFLKAFKLPFETQTFSLTRTYVRNVFKGFSKVA